MPKSEAIAMKKNRFLTIAVSMILAGSASALAESPAQQLFDQATFLLEFAYNGFSKVDIKALAPKYQPLLNEACAGDNDCDYEMAQPIIDDLVKEIGDGHANYYSPQANGSLKRSFAGQGSGVIRIGIVHDEVEGSNDRIIADVVEDGPADKAGFRRGDRITAVDGTPIPKGEDAARALMSSRISTGRDVRFSLLRAGESIEIIVKGERNTTPRLPTLKTETYYGTKLPKEVAVLKIPSFDADEKVANTVHELVRKAQKDGIKSLVIDLRENGGGLSTEHIASIGAFLPDGVTVQYQGRFQDNLSSYTYSAGKIFYRAPSGNTAPRNIYTVTNPTVWTGSVVVLVNKNSASAAEYFATNIKSAKRGLVFGEATAGVGNTSTQILNLIDSSGLQIPLNRAIQGDGTPYPATVTPDVMIPDDLLAINKTGKDMVLEKALESLAKK
jgi:carboxyl-terminal processing protease